MASDEIVYVCDYCGWTGKQDDLNFDERYYDDGSWEYWYECPECMFIIDPDVEA